MARNFIVTVVVAGRGARRHNRAMRMWSMRMWSAAILLLWSARTLAAAKNLEVYAIDVEGGQATLFVSPSGDSMLVDTGWGGFNSRDALRIGAAGKLAGDRSEEHTSE